MRDKERKLREDLEFISKNIPKLVEGIMKAQAVDLKKQLADLEKSYGKINKA